MFYRLLYCIAAVLFLTNFAVPNAAMAERLIVVDFTHGDLFVLDGEKQGVLMSTPVALPKGNYYPVPVSGTVTKAEMGPWWFPTDNMLEQYPDKYKERYAPYEPGNAMGHCKVYIDFHDDDPELRSTRIHGNAKKEDLRKRVSRSCVRIPDELCPTLVEAIERYDGPVRVQFVR